MGLQDDVDRARRERAEAERLTQAWSVSPFQKADPPVVAPSAEISALLREAIPLLGKARQIRVFNGQSPDGVTRVTDRTEQRKGGLFRAAWPGWNQLVWQITVVPSVKDGPRPVDLLVLDERRVAWKSNSPWDQPAPPSTEEVRAALVRYLA